MVPPVVSGSPIQSKVILIGQAPGKWEGEFGKPFAWTAGKTLFKWLSQIGLEEEQARKKIYFAAVCRCFPGKNVKGGDRVPSEDEIINCSQWLKKEVELLQPDLLIPVGKLAISQFMPVTELASVIGKKLTVEVFGLKSELIALPHPSGASTWHRREPGITLLKKALALLRKHPSVKALL